MYFDGSLMKTGAGAGLLFISRLGEKGLPLYCLLRKAERFTWTPEAEEALGNLKALLINAPILVPPLREKPS